MQSRFRRRLALSMVTLSVLAALALLPAPAAALYSCNLGPGKSCTQTTGTLSANTLYEITGDVSLSGGDSLQHAWIELAYFEGGQQVSGVSQNMWNWVGNYPIGQMLYVLTGSSPGYAQITITNTDPVSQVYAYSFSAVGLQARTFSNSNSASGVFNNIGPGGGQCTFLYPSASTLYTFWGSVDVISGNKANYYVYFIKYDQVGSIVSTRFAAYREGVAEVGTLDPTTSGPSVALCVMNVDSSTQTFTWTLKWRWASGTVSPAIWCSGSQNTPNAGAQSTWGPTNICTVTDTTKMYVAYLRVNLNGGDNIQYVNLETRFDQSHTEQAWYNWQMNPADTAASKPSTSQSLQLTIHNSDSASQVFTYAWWVLYF